MNRRSFLGATASLATSITASAAFAQSAAAAPVRYPDPAVKILDPRFAGMVPGSAAVERLYTGTRWAEGPVWFGDGRYLLWSDIPNNRIMRWVEETGEVSVFRQNANYSNGNTRDLEGRLVTCERRRVTRTEYDGSITVLADEYKGKKLNGPNDAVAHPDGHLVHRSRLRLALDVRGNTRTPRVARNGLSTEPADGRAESVSRN